MMIRSFWRGLGRKTPAPKRSISNRPAPVAIISMAQHARPNVMGQSADLRAQLTTGAAMSTVFAPTLRRIEFMIESTVVKTNPSSCSAIYHFRFMIADCRFILSPSIQKSAIGNRKSAIVSRPLQGAFAPRVVITHHQDRDEDKHFQERKLCKGKVISHKDNSPWQEKDRFDVEDEKQHRDDVITHRKALVRLGRRVDAALVRAHLVLLVFDRTQKPAEHNRQHRKDHGHAEKNHDRPVSCNRAANSLSCSSCRLKKHHSLAERDVY